MARISGNRSVDDMPFGSFLIHHGRIICALIVMLALLPVRAGQPAENLSVLTWNVWGLPFITPDRSTRIDQAVIFLRESQADIIAIQEAWLPGDIAKLRNGLEAVGYQSVHFRSFPFGSGLIIFSRLPMTSPKFEAFRYGGKPHKPYDGDWYAGKGFGSVTVETPLGPLIVANTHLHARYRPPEYLAGQLTQITDLAQGIDSLTEQGKMPCLVVGDLNSPRDGLPFRLLSELTSMRPARRAPDGVDWVLAQSGTSVSCEVTQSKKLPVPPLKTGAPVSDHKPVVGIISMKPAGKITPTMDAASISQEVGDILQSAARTAMISGVAAAASAIAMLFAWRRLRTSSRSLPSKISGILALLAITISAYQIYLWFVFSQALTLLREHL